MLHIASSSRTNMSGLNLHNTTPYLFLRALFLHSRRMFQKHPRAQRVHVHMFAQAIRRLMDPFLSDCQLE